MIARSVGEKTQQQSFSVDDFNYFMKLVCDKSFENKLYEDFKSIHCDMTVWNDKNAAIDNIKRILAMYVEQQNKIKTILQTLSHVDVTNANVECIKPILQTRLAVLQQDIDKYTESWLERCLTLHPTQLAPSICLMQTESVEVRIKKSFTEALYVFQNEELRKQISMKDIIAVLDLFGKKGMDFSAGEQLCRYIYVEISKRIIDGKIKEFDTDVDYIKDSFKEIIPDCYMNLDTIIQTNFEDKKSAFAKIYTALRDGQTGFMKTNFLEGKEDLKGEEFIQAVVDDVEWSPASRVAKAWDLTKRYYRDCTTGNIDMMTEIYKWSFNNSSYFSQSKVFGTTFFKSASIHSLKLSAEKISASKENENTRTGRICRAIGG